MATSCVANSGSRILTRGSGAAQEVFKYPQPIPPFDVCAVVPCNAGDEGRVVLLLLVKDFSGTVEGSAEDQEGKLSSFLDVAAKFHYLLATSGEFGTKFCANLANGIPKLFPAGQTLEVAKLLGSNAARFFLGSCPIQFVVAVAFLAGKPASTPIGMPFPRLPHPGVDAYLLPQGTDMAQFTAYLVAKNALGWRPDLGYSVRQCAMEQQALVRQTFTRAVLGVVLSAVILCCLGTLVLVPMELLSVALIALLCAEARHVAKVCGAAKQEGASLQREILASGSWSLQECPPQFAEEVARQMTPEFARQLLAEVRQSQCGTDRASPCPPEEESDDSSKLAGGKIPVAFASSIGAEPLREPLPKEGVASIASALPPDWDDAFA